MYLGDSAEISLAVDDLSEATSLFKKLAFQEVATLELPYPTAAFSDGRIRFALHEAIFPSPTLTYFDSDIRAVTPSLHDHARSVQELQREGGIPTALSCRTPDNWRIVLASQHPAAPGAPTRESRCGTFIELAFPTRSIQEALDFWSTFGFQTRGGSAQPYRYASLSNGSLSVGLHETKDFDQPACIFRTADPGALVADLENEPIEVLRQSENRAAIEVAGGLILIFSSA